jgi:hypothetical protein
MPGFEDQQALQQLLTGMNTMQMQSGLMPGGIPALHNNNVYTPPPIQSPAQFSNNLAINFQRTFQYQPTPPPMFGSVTPVPRTDYAPMPGAGFGGGWGAARQQAQNGATNSLTSTQAVGGFGARAAFSTGIGLLASPFITPMGGAALGMGADMLLGSTVEKMAQLPFKPMIDQQQRAMQLQNMSMNNVRRGSDLSASGIGLSLTASMDLERNLMRMSDNRGFKRDTNNAFNRQDMMKITDLSSQVGLLDNAQGGDQIAREMGKIGRALASFMKVIEEPDVRKALQMMGNMRNMGMSLNETNAAAANARTFARMAGTTVQGVMQAGMQGANVFQQYGMSGATGMNIGMASVGTAGVLGTTMDPRTLGLLGGREGMAQSLTNSAAQVSQITAILPGLLKTGKDGRLTVDKDAVNNLLTGQTDIQSLVRASAAKMTGVGAENFINQYSYRKSALQDEVMHSMGGQGGMMLPLILAKKMVDQGVTKDIGAALRSLGLDEKQAETGRQLLASGTIGDVMRQQERTATLEAQRGRAAKREGLEEAASQARWSGLGKTALEVGAGAFGARTGAPLILGAAYGIQKGSRALGNIYDRLARENYGEDVDLEEQRIASGGGRVLRTYRPGELADPTGTKALRGQIQTHAGVLETERREYADWQRKGPLQDEVTRTGGEIDKYTGERRLLRNAALPVRVVGAVSRMFSGPGGVGVSGIGQGGESLVDTVNAHMGLYDRMRTGVIAESLNLDLGLNKQQYLGRAHGEASLGKDIELALSTTSTRQGVVTGEGAGLSITQTAKFTTAAATKLRNYLADKETFGVQTRTVTEQDINAQIDQAIAADPALKKLSDKDKLAFRNNMRADIIRTAAQGMDPSRKAFLHKLAGQGAESDAQLGPGATRQKLLSRAETTREAALKSFGIDTGWGADMGSARAAMAVFSTPGEEGAMQQKYLVAESLEEAANAAEEGSEEQSRLRQRAKEIRYRLDKNPDQEATAKARSAAAAAAGKMSHEHKVGIAKSIDKDLGKREGEAANKQLEKDIISLTGGLESATTDVKTESELELFGSLEALNVYKEGLKDNTSAKKLAEYAKAHGGKAGKFSAEEYGSMSGDTLANEIERNMEKGATGTFSEGLSQLYDNLTGPSTSERVAARNLEEEGRKQKRLYNAADNEGKFAMTVDKFAEATAALKIAAADLSGKDSVTELIGTIQKSGFMETVEKANAGFAGLFGIKG